MKTKFTRGEWSSSKNLERIGVIDNSDSQSHGMMNEVAFVDMYNFDEEECIANAHLIAAAPKLYAIAETLIENYQVAASIAENEGYATDYITDLELVEKLLAEARGE